MILYELMMHNEYKGGRKEVLYDWVIACYKTSVELASLRWRNLNMKICEHLETNITPVKGIQKVGELKWSILYLLSLLIAIPYPKIEPNL